MDAAAGTVTLFFTDIEGSTRLLQNLGGGYAALLEEHRRILAACIEAQGGRLVDSQGDSCFASFPRASGAVLAAVAAQRAFAAGPWPGNAELRVRMGLHTGEPAMSGQAYVGIDVHKAARIGALAQGGQILLSEATKSLVEATLPEGSSLRDLGEHELKDIGGPNRLFELVVKGLSPSFPPPRSRPSSSSSLPSRLSGFIGREKQRRELALALREDRLLTLMGPGGTGKTRLSLVVAEDLLSAGAFPDGAFFVELGSLTEGSLVPRSAAASLGLSLDSGLPAPERLADYLRKKDLLLILDNCEHLVEACAFLAETLLKGAPGLRILATSRESLGIEGERVWRLPSLALPPPGLKGAAQVGAFESVRLFVDRARAVNPAFALRDENSQAVSEICRRLDGIPLAIELAASRMKVLSAAQISERIDDRFRLLTGGSRNAVPRQATLRALVDWSHELLAPDEKVMLRRLSAFSGGWTVEAAEAVCGDPGGIEVLDALTGLIDKSLVATEESEGSGRHRLLETIRDYARERLLDSAEAETLREAHLRYFLELAQRTDPLLRGPGQRFHMGVLDRERANLRSALEWSSQAREASSLMALAVSLWRYWRMRSDFSEGRRWLGLALRLNPDAPAADRARCLLRAGSLANYQGDYREAHPLLALSLELHRSLGVTRELADALILLANTLMMRGELEQSRSLLAESLSICQSLGDARGIAYACFSSGTLLMTAKELPEARSMFERSRSRLLELGDDWWLASVDLQLAWIRNREGDHEGALAALAQVLVTERDLEDIRGAARAALYAAEARSDSGDIEGARAGYAEALRSLTEIGDRWWIAVCIEGLALARVLGGEAELCATLLGAAEAIRQQIGTPVLPLYRDRLEESASRAESVTGSASFSRLKAEGRLLPLDAAISLALS